MTETTERFTSVIRAQNTGIEYKQGEKIIRFLRQKHKNSQEAFSACVVKHITAIPGLFSCISQPLMVSLWQWACLISPRSCDFQEITDSIYSFWLLKLLLNSYNLPN